MFAWVFYLETNLLSILKSIVNDHAKVNYKISSMAGFNICVLQIKLTKEKEKSSWCICVCAYVKQIIFSKQNSYLKIEDFIQQTNLPKIFKGCNLVITWDWLDFFKSPSSRMFFLFICSLHISIKENAHLRLLKVEKGDITIK